MYMYEVKKKWNSVLSDSRDALENKILDLSFISLAWVTRLPLNKPLYQCDAMIWQTWVTIPVLNLAVVTGTF